MYTREEETSVSHFIIDITYSTVHVSHCEMYNSDKVYYDMIIG